MSNLQEKISVIIPTLQKRNSVTKLLIELLNRDESVDEIILINNLAGEKIPYALPDKVKLITPDKNLYVNASWNLGIKLSRNDIFLIANDDMLPVENICSIIINSKILNDEKTGLLGACNIKNIYDEKDLSIENSKAKLFPLTLNSYKTLDYWGIAIFGRKENYYEIPNEIKIIYGDNYLVYKNIQNKKICYSLFGLPFKHWESSSSNIPEYAQIIQNDINNKGNLKGI